MKSSRCVGVLVVSGCRYMRNMRETSPTWTVISGEEEESCWRQNITNIVSRSGGVIHPRFTDALMLIVKCRVVVLVVRSLYITSLF